MPDIALLIRIDGEVQEVYRQVSTLKGIARWFTHASATNYSPGNTLTLFEDGSCRFEVAKMEPNAEIEWRCISDESIWANTVIRFKFEQDVKKTIVRFDHGGWSEKTDIYRDCAMSWAYFLESLKLLIETGSGTPEGVAPPCESG